MRKDLKASMIPSPDVNYQRIKDHVVDITSTFVYKIKFHDINYLTSHSSQMILDASGKFQKNWM